MMLARLVSLSGLLAAASATTVSFYGEAS